MTYDVTYTDVHFTEDVEDAVGGQASPDTEAEQEDRRSREEIRKKIFKKSRLRE